MSQPVVVALSVVIPVYGRFDLLDECIAALAAGTTTEHEVIVVDDASPDGPPTCRDGIRVVRRDENGGFARAANTGIASATGTHVAVLNSDAVVSDGWDVALIGALDGGAALAAAFQSDVETVVGGTIVGDDGHVVLMSADTGDGPARAVPAVGGACVMARRADLLRWGGFSTSYGRGYYEDVDLSLLIHGLGLRCVVGAATVVHRGGESFGSDETLRRLEIGRDVLRRRWWWTLRHRPPVHDWETRPHRAGFARACGRSGRLLLLADEVAPVVSAALWGDDVSWERVSPASFRQRSDPSLLHWADVVVGSREDLSLVEAALDATQPRAPRVESVLGAGVDIHSLMSRWRAEGLGRSAVRPGPHAPRFGLPRRGAAVVGDR